jgi:hypothetical protein
VLRGAVFFLMSHAQFKDTRRPFASAGLATLVMGALVELAEGVSGRGNCRLRDLVPDSASALLGAAFVLGCRRRPAGFARARPSLP